MQQVIDGIADAFLLASYAVAMSEQVHDTIFMKYFNPANRSAVMGK